MALIEGVGDEVTLLFGVVFLALVLVLAWASTHTADRSEHLFAPAPAPGPASSHRTAPSSPESAGPEPLPPESAPAPGGLGEEGKDEPRGEAGAEGQAAAGGAEVGDGSPSDGGFGSDGLRHREPAGPAQTSPGPAPSQPSPASTESATPDDAQRNMVLRLKFLNDTERVAQVKPEDTIGYIKRTYFTGQEHQVRLIYQGQLLRDDAQTLASLNLADNCVLHCHVSQHATPQVPAGARAADQVHVALNVGSLMVPFFVLMLSVLWYFQIQYRQFFTATATASLVGLTIFFSFVAFGLYRR